MLKIILVALLPLLAFLQNGSDTTLTGPEKKGTDGNTGTLEKMIVASGNVTMDLKLDRLNGAARRTKSVAPSKLRFEAQRDSFFTIVTFNDELRALLPSAMSINPQASAALPAKLNASYNQLVIETLPLGGPYELAFRDGRTGYTFFNVEGQEVEYIAAERLLKISNGRMLLSEEFAADLGRPNDVGTIVGEVSIAATMKSIQVTQVVEGEVTSDTLPPMDSPSAGTVPGPDVVVGDLSGLAQFGTSGTRVGLAVATDSCNFGTEPLNWFANPANDHPVIPQNLYRMSGGPGNDERFEQIGQSNVKHGFTALQQNLCNLGCNSHPNGTRLGSGCSDPYSASLNAGPNLGSKAWINPFTGAFPRNDSATPNNNHTGHAHDGTSHRILTEISDLSTTQNPGASYYAESTYVTPHEYSWCQANPTQCNMFNNTSYRRYNVSGTGSPFSFSAAAATVRSQTAINAWPGSTRVQINPAPGIDGIGTVAYKVTNPSPGVWHYEYAIHNETLDRAIQSFNVPITSGAVLSNIGFHAPPQHPGWSGDNTAGNAGYSNAPWAQSQTATSMTWSSETLAQNPNANAIRWATMYNFRFDSNRPPTTVNAVVGFYKTGAPITVQVQAPGGVPPAPTPTPTPTPNPSICTPTLTVTEVTPGSAAAFEAITAGPNSVTVDAANSGIGLQGLTLVSSVNATVSIPAVAPGTYTPVASTFTINTLGQPVDFTLRASSRINAVLIRAQCVGAPIPTPTPVITPTPVPPTPTPTPVPGRIIVDKVTNPSGNTTNFEFDTTYTDNFFLADATTPNNSGLLAPGQYQLAELVPAGWSLTNMGCSIADVAPLGDSTFGTQPVPLPGPGLGVISVVLGAGDTVTCTFTNTLGSSPTPTPVPPTPTPTPVPPTPTPTPVPPTPTPTPIPPTPTPTPNAFCTPTLTVTEVFPGSAAAFTSITAGPGTVTVDPVNTGVGLQGFTLVSATNANVAIPSFPFGTTGPVSATFTRPNAAQAVDFTLRASSRASAVLIRAQCNAFARVEQTGFFDLSFWLLGESIENLFGPSRKPEETNAGE